MSEKSEPFLKFEPVYQRRVWGGRALESRLKRNLPADDQPYGESWEISARTEADSRVSTGLLEGIRLTEIWENPGLSLQIFGPGAPRSNRFPLLCKILDARSRLSIQVHPPADVADRIGGEPKSEAWYIADAKPGAKIYVGIRKGVTRESFRQALAAGKVEELVHAIPVEKGQYIYIPSGRLHAIGSGIMIYEIQENSDTTFRVFDWNRVGLDGELRDLHIEESLQCIDFKDFEPGMDRADGKVLCQCDYFRIERHRLEDDFSLGQATNGRFAIVTITGGSLSIGETQFSEGDFFMVPFGHSAEGFEGSAEILLTLWPE